MRSIKKTISHMSKKAGNQVKKRDSSIELLRIVAMIIIVFHHFANHGGFQWEPSTININRLWYNFIIMGGKIGVDIFVLISGYYLISDSAELSVSKLLKLWGQIFFYSIALFLLYSITGICNFDAKNLVSACMPITFSQWWFASTYFVLYLIHPLLNKLLNCLDRGLYQKLILLMVFCWSIMPTFTTEAFEGNDLIWFITLYTIAGYIRLYGLNARLKTNHYIWGWIAATVITYGLSFIFTVLGKNRAVFSSEVTYFYGQEKITTLIISICLFMIFVSLKMNYHRWINILASATFGVYLLHDSIPSRIFLWKQLFDNAKYQSSWTLIPYSIMVVVVVYVVCTIIDLGRQYLIEKPFMKVVDFYLEGMMKRINSVMDKFKTLIFGEVN